MAVTEEPSTAMAAAAEPAQTLAALPPCINTIERHIASLRSAAATDASWSEQQDDVSQLVQATLDCRDAKLAIAGSLELLGSSLADLRVRWDRTDWNLDLAMIDSSQPAPEPAAMRADDQMIEFVIR